MTVESVIKDDRNHEQNTLERIYIGGINPPRLTTTDVLKRLRSIKEIDVLNVNDDDDGRSPIDDETKTFLHVTARWKRSMGVIKEEEEVGTTKKQSVLEVLVKQYHNVRWKGCRLRVERARPHFLERLKLERKERMMTMEEELGRNKKRSSIDSSEKEQEEDENDRTKNEDNDTPKNEAIILPRHLRIRRRFGEEVHHVDTKPRIASNWTDLNKHLDSLRRRKEKHRVKLVEYEAFLKKKKRGRISDDEKKKGKVVVEDARILPFLNRAVHVRFHDDDAEDSMRGRRDGDGVVVRGPSSGRLDSSAGDEDNAVTVSDNEEDDSLEESSGSGDGSSASSSSSSGSEEEDEGSTEGGMKSKYVWSDEEDDDEDDNTGDGGGSDPKHNDEEGSDVSSESDTEHHPDSANANPLISHGKRNDIELSPEEVVQNKELEAAARPNTGQKYVWSDDDDDDDDEDDSSSSSSSSDERPSIPPRQLEATFDSMLDEFSAAVDYDDGTDADETEEGHPSGLDNEKKETTEKPVDLTEDVSSNLDILSKLFPDMKDTTPNLVAPSGSDEEETTPKDRNAKHSAEKLRKEQRPGWEEDSADRGNKLSLGLGRMQRYDPTKESAQKYVVRVDEGDDDDVGDDSDGASGPDDSQDNDKKTKKEDDTTHQPSSETPSTDDNNHVKANMDDGNKKVYEQDKLEDIFRQARETTDPSGGSGMFQMSSLFQEKLEAAHDVAPPTLAAPPPATAATNPVSSGEGSFSFSFQLGNADGMDATPPVTNEEHAQVEQQTRVSDSTNKVAASSSSTAPSPSEVIESSPSSQYESKIRRGMKWPKHVLNEYEDAFFAMNDGAKIIADLEGTRNEERGQTAWMEERKGLTLDWKRKRKYAVSKKEKKMKFR